VLLQTNLPHTGSTCQILILVLEKAPTEITQSAQIGKESALESWTKPWANLISPPNWYFSTSKHFEPYWLF